MPEDIPDTLDASQLEAWRLALAALEAERKRLIEKYGRRIAELKKAIKTLERDLARQPKRTSAKEAARPKRARKAKASK